MVKNVCQLSIEYEIFVSYKKNTLFQSDTDLYYDI